MGNSGAKRKEVSIFSNRGNYSNKIKDSKEVVKAE
jgi:hypothetical protein